MNSRSRSSSPLSSPIKALAAAAAAASLLLFAGADEDAVFADYLRTNDMLLPAFDTMFARFAERGGDPDILVPILGVRREYLETAIDEALTRYGSIEGYFAAGLGLSDTALQALRDRLVAPQE